jgi:hypothetical protein
MPVEHVFCGLRINGSKPLGKYTGKTAIYASHDSRKEAFSGLDRKQIEHSINPLPLTLASAIKILNEDQVVQVPTSIFNYGLGLITDISEVHLADSGEHFRMVTHEFPSIFSGLREVISQCLSKETHTSDLRGKDPFLSGYIGITDERIVNKRGLSAWIDIPTDHTDTLALYIKMDRFYGSLSDYAVAVIPIPGINVTDMKTYPI